MEMLHFPLCHTGAIMVHGHTFHFIDEPGLHDDRQVGDIPHIAVEALRSDLLLQSYPLKRPWVPLSGQKGRYFSKYPFEEADALFSWGIEIKEVLTLVWLPEEKKVVYSKGKHYKPERLQFWLFHTFFPMVLQLAGVYHILHVGSVEVKGKPVIFSAPSFGGKSTLTDFFIQKGHTLFSDDSLGIHVYNETYFAVPSYPFHRPYREVESLGYFVENFAKEERPVSAVFILQKADAKAKVTLKELTGIEKIIAFNGSSFIEFPFMKKEYFEFLAGMVRTIPVYRITIPWDMKRLDEVYRQIVNTTTKL